jgi:putative membrane protein
MMHWHGGGGGWVWMAFFMPLIWIALIGLVGWAVFRLTRGAAGGPGDHGHGQGAWGPRGDRGTWESPEDILDRRYASGEIDADTYTEARERLAAHRPKPR